jgi:hypothetical protein
LQIAEICCGCGEENGRAQKEGKGKDGTEEEHQVE